MPLPEPASFCYLHLICCSQPDSQSIRRPEAVTLAGFLQRQGAEKAVELLELSILPDHLHALIQLQATQSPHQVARWLMDAASDFLTTIQMTEQPFAWQPAYWCFSVSPNTLGKARDYLRHQATLHEKMTLEAELERMISLVG